LIGVHQRDVADIRAGDNAWMQTAIATRWRPKSAWARELPGQTPYASVLAATIALPIGCELLFLAAKPSWRFDAEAERCAQALAIAEIDCAFRAAAPTIIAGDFDATPDAECMRFYTGKTPLNGHSAHYRDAWAIAGDGSAGDTWTTQNHAVAALTDTGLIDGGHARRIDYVLLGSPHSHPKVRAWVRTCRLVLTDPPASDHYGVLAEIEFRTRRA
jgi:endonuclease/exonuclease/phosphatase family metal-dependent hydrolase